MKPAYIALIVVSLAVIGGLAYFGMNDSDAPAPVVEQAQQDHSEFLKTAEGYTTQEERLLNTTRYVFENAEKSEALALLTSLLQEQGIEAQAWQLVTPSKAQKAIMVKDPQGGFKHLDPINGVVAMYENRQIIGPYAARFLLMDGADYRSVFVKLNDDADLSFYEQFSHAMIAPPGHPLYISVAAPVLEEPLKLGEIDGQSEDVASASSDINITEYFDYLGHKHEDPVERTMYFTEDAKITFVMTENVDPEMLKTNIAPQIDANKVTFVVKGDDPLTLEQDVKANQKNTINYVAVDQIVIERL